MNKQLLTKPKAIIMGVDRVITDVNTWFHFLTEIRIDLDKHRRIYGLLKDGKARWDDVKDDLFPIPHEEEERIHKSRFDQSIGNIEISGDAIATIHELQDRGYHICIVSGSIDLIVKSIARRLGINDWYANTTLLFDQHNYWTGIDWKHNEGQVKLEQAMDFVTKHNLKPEEVLVLGHSSADLDLFKKFPSVAIGKSNQELIPFAEEEIDYFTRILQILKKFE